MKKTQPISIKKIVFAGHVDHGKSSTIGRLLEESGTISQQTIQLIKNQIPQTEEAFNYAYVIDRLQNERRQNKTIDTARCILKLKKERYQLIDVPGHTELIKNMLTGASRADLAVLVIDAQEGLRKNSRRHAQLISFLGFKKCLVCINKIDLINFQENIFNNVRKQCHELFIKLGLEAHFFIPISAALGDNISKRSKKTPWYKGPVLLSALIKSCSGQCTNSMLLRLPIQDIYTINSKQVFVGRVEAGELKKSQSVCFQPGNIKTKIKTINFFGAKKISKAKIGECPAFTVAKKITGNPGLLLTAQDDTSTKQSNKIKAIVLWLSKKPLNKKRLYTLKIGANKVKTKIIKINNILDTISLNYKKNNIVNNYQTAECTLKLDQTIAYDTNNSLTATSHFVLVDNKNIVGSGIIKE